MKKIYIEFEKLKKNKIEKNWNFKTNFKKFPNWKILIKIRNFKKNLKLWKKFKTVKKLKILEKNKSSEIN